MKYPLYINYIIKNFIFNTKGFTKDLFEDISKDIKAKKNKTSFRKIWICGLPKSGTTLIENILNNLLYIQIEKSILRMFPNKNKISDKNIDEYISCFPKNKFTYVKTHLEYNQNVLNKLLNQNFKVIITLRDLRDALISRYFHVLSDKNHWQHDVVKNLNFEEGFINSLTIKTKKFPNPNFEEPIKYYYNWIRNWNKVENSKNIKKIWYEGYNENAEKFIKEILNFTNFNELDEKEIENKLSLKRKEEKNIPLIKKLKRRGKNVSTFRSGKSNNWKDLFTEKINDKFNKLLPGKIENILN